MKRSELIITAVLVPVDFCLVFLAGLTAYNLRFGWLLAVRPAVLEMKLQGYMLLDLAFAAIFVVVFAMAGLYAIAGGRRLKFELARLFVASAGAVMAAIVVVFFRGELFSSRFIVLAAWGFAFLYVAIGRIAVRLFQRLLLKYGIGAHRLILIGAGNPVATDLVTGFAEAPSMGYRVIAQFAAFDDAARTAVERLATARAADEIIVADPDLHREDIADVLAFCQSRHLGFRYSADLLATRVANVEIGALAGHPIVEVKETKLDGWWRIGKRAFDLAVSFILIVVLSPVMLVTAIAVKFSSLGPIFFHLDDGTLSHRIGEHGRVFPFLKFRSMYFGTHMQRYHELAAQDTRTDGPLVKIKDDPRITKVGKFIRKYSIDELPQLFSVFIGDMSLVGPRPHHPEEVAKYTDRQRRVLAIKPGITGMAQVEGRANLTFNDEVRLDTFYIENWTPLLDLAILVKTPLAVLMRKGAS
jgi:exopolysaccharide biosynthesis polyprenyl glycosylphosphotransferase